MGRACRPVGEGGHGVYGRLRVCRIARPVARADERFVRTAAWGLYGQQLDRGQSKFRKLIPIKNTTVLADRFETIAEVLQKAGYVTATMGKWHLGKDPTTQGFDVNVLG